jgi:hypothetical protein
MWAVIGVWEIDSSLIDDLRALVPEMARGKVGMLGFVHGTWTLDGHVMMVFADEGQRQRVTIKARPSNDDQCSRTTPSSPIIAAGQGAPPNR